MTESWPPWAVAISEQLAELDKRIRALAPDEEPWPQFTTEQLLEARRREYALGLQAIAYKTARYNSHWQRFKRWAGFPVAARYHRPEWWQTYHHKPYTPDELASSLHLQWHDGVLVDRRSTERDS